MIDVHTRDLQDAMQHLDRRRELKDRLELGMLLASSGHGSKLDEAKIHLTTALTLAQEEGDRASQMVAFATLGNISMHAGLMDEAEARYRDELAIAMDEHLLSESARAKMHVARVLLHRNQVQPAHDMLTGAVDDARLALDRTTEVRACYELCHVCHILGQGDRAAHYFDLAQRLSEHVIKHADGAHGPRTIRPVSAIESVA